MVAAATLRRRLRVCSGVSVPGMEADADMLDFLLVFVVIVG